MKLPQDLDPSYVLNLGMAFTASRTLLSAVELDLFTLLHGNPLTGEELVRELQLHERSNPDFFDTLFALKILKRDGSGETAKYSNTAESQAFLNTKSSLYIGDGLKMCAIRLYAYWNGLTDALRTGKMQTEGKEEGYVFDNIYKTDDKMQTFLRAMISLNGRAHKVFAKKFDFSNYTTMLDVGGGLGQLSIDVVKENPNMRCITMDLKRVESAAIDHVRMEGQQDRIEVVSSDIFVNEFAEADVVTMGMILHDHSLENKIMLIEKAFRALPEGGAFVAIEMLIDNEREKHVEALLMSLSMLNGMPGGFDYTGSDFERWTKAAGFKSCSIVELKYPTFAAIAFK